MTNAYYKEIIIAQDCEFIPTYIVTGDDSYDILRQWK
jgi:hypothetical protein